MLIDPGSYLDLQRLVRQLRESSLKRAEIPAHSGTADSETRKARRAERTALAQNIARLEREIVAWALATVPVSENEIPKGE